MNLTELKRLFKLLGPNGTLAGLQASNIEHEVFTEIATKAKVILPTDASRNATIQGLVDSLIKKDLKPTDALLKMSYEELVQYFNEMGPTNDQLLKIMKDLNFKVGSEDKRHLRRFVARQISETALFASVALRNGDEKEK
jgi:hypothetical protein